MVKVEVNMARQQADDQLFEIKNYFYIGNYQQCIKEAHKLTKPPSAEIAIQRDLFTYRSYLAQNKFLVVLEEIKSTSPEEIQPLKFLAEYLQSKSKRESVLSQLEHKLKSTPNKNETLIVVAATIYVNEGKYDKAHRVLHLSESLEALAFVVDLYLKIRRLDLARKKLKEMQDKDDDATLTQLATAWVNIATGGEKLQDAYYIYQELVDKYGATPILLNGQAVSFIGQQKYEEAEAALQEALDKDPNYPDTLINLIVLNRQISKEDVAARYLSQLMDANAEHPFIKHLKKKEIELANIAKQYGPTVTVVPEPDPRRPATPEESEVSE